LAPRRTHGQSYLPCSAASARRRVIVAVGARRQVAVGARARARCLVHLGLGQVVPREGKEHLKPGWNGATHTHVEQGSVISYGHRASAHMSVVIRGGG